eukprot:CAMPEP_0202498460 /NCGR_PEP_ID=MMETSP1361-20130828/26117_1 /ASSEMBLY_ACC=CAM_ASM_000849 /TAXON_ID=210615 /ORGANISM="Staurosira complex sp., Strain CCMP2646" /LENGTH=31 /DNA_ID= /DNA_START= /DNA_END= /DNA_ORIENTATION=
MNNGALLSLKLGTDSRFCIGNRLLNIMTKTI